MKRTPGELLLCIPSLGNSDASSHFKLRKTELSASTAEPSGSCNLLDYSGFKLLSSLHIYAACKGSPVKVFWEFFWEIQITEVLTVKDENIAQ